MVYFSFIMFIAVYVQIINEKTRRWNEKCSRTSDFPMNEFVSINNGNFFSPYWTNLKIWKKLIVNICFIYGGNLFWLQWSTVYIFEKLYCRRLFHLYQSFHPKPYSIGKWFNRVCTPHVIVVYFTIFTMQLLKMC